MGHDSNFKTYIGMHVSDDPSRNIPLMDFDGLQNAIMHGLKEEAKQYAQQLLVFDSPLDIIQKELIPALDKVGKGYELGEIFLPNLLMSAEAAKVAFDILKEKLSSSDIQNEKKEKIVLATVKGDIHDIGKNIIKVLLENYGFEVFDLGKDVAPERIADVVVEQKIELVGLSALMTTTVESMKETILLLKKVAPECKVMVGGAVLNQDYADMIGADFYGKDAMQSVYYAKKILRNESERN
jgi:5-methyltetrahydrofolate--homocysteine methyltransferase